ncbi:glycoside hydrolase family 3 N-terminal domain-containing protein [Microbacterium stercoris]|uniref:beta-N-acetylhexosaminidase n=1 Tax=Microbacterium stercoris TaxID=2820289 RepID=A0A939QJF7_9MICO|nr:glycoside hydrolase family 3 N-terminal domain-containing protein [Microbacterium stercoris]MBO3664023.1 glycoside hydrolase family 3 protein [Microbacterium stercoris]
MSLSGRGRSAWLAAALAGLVLVLGAPQGATASATAEAAPATRGEVAAALAEEIVDDLSIEERAATVVMGSTAGTDPSTLASYLHDGGLGGFILMGSNVPPSEPALRALTNAMHGDADALPPLLATDQEGGIVSRLRWDDGPAGAALQALPPAKTEAAFEARGRLLERGGVDVNFGIVADVGTATSGFIRSRTLGADATSAAERVAAAVEGERHHVLSTLKHFPGHGAAAGDSHHTIPQTDMGLDEWRASHAPPFAAGIDSGAELVMSGHLRFTDVSEEPASLSPEWYDILRDELGFEGVAVTDDLGMLLASGERKYADPVRNAVMAISAGADLALMVAGSDVATARAMAAGIASEVEPARLEEAATRVVTLRVLASGLLDDPVFED